LSIPNLNTCESSIRYVRKFKIFIHSDGYAREL
jgi:hypothetical protein